MKLPKPNPRLDLAAQIAEFDVWITPSLGEICDTDRFQRQLTGIITVFDALAATTNEFRNITDCSPEAIAEALLRLIAGLNQQEAATVLSHAASLLFLTTGKSDNNAKCQFPLHLRDRAKWPGFPQIRGLTSKTSPQMRPIPRSLPSATYMPLIASLQSHPDHQRRLLLEFVRFLLSDDHCVAQLWSIGYSYSRMKAFEHERDLLTPLVIFQVRGSVSASGGHDPERMLRSVFHDMGLTAGYDYNVADVVIDSGAASVNEENGGQRRGKTRAYDFVLPFRVRGWKNRIYIQSQYYAGDSGSVSHKNVDQTSASRKSVRKLNKAALFVEYVDGAGYFSSLTGDLKNLLSMQNTHSFFQVRSAPIRMRRNLQEIGFLTSMEVEHAIARTNGERASVAALLRDEGYAAKEIQRCIETSLQNKLITENGDTLRITTERRAIVRRYYLLDTVGCFGTALGPSAEAGYLLVPGYGAFHGMKLVDLLKCASKYAPDFAGDLADSKALLADVQWLVEKKFAMSS